MTPGQKCHKLWHYFGVGPGLSQASHVLQVARAVAFDSGKLLLQIGAETVDDPGASAFGLLATGYPKTWSDRAKSLTLPRWFGWEAGLFLLAPQTSEDVQHSGHERIWARVRPERYGFKRWNIGFERTEDHPPCRQFLR